MTERDATRHETGRTTADVNTVINPPHCRRSRSRGLSRSRGREIKAYPGHNNTQVRTCPTEKSYIRKEERRQEGRSQGYRRNAVSVW